MLLHNVQNLLYEFVYFNRFVTFVLFVVKVYKKQR